MYFEVCQDFNGTGAIVALGWNRLPSEFHPGATVHEQLGPDSNSHQLRAIQLETGEGSHPESKKGFCQKRGFNHSHTG